MSTGGFYEGGYSGYGGSTNSNSSGTGGNSIPGGGGYSAATGSHDSFGGGAIGPMSFSSSASQSQGPNVASMPSSSSLQQNHQSQSSSSNNMNNNSSNGNPNAMNSFGGMSPTFWNPTTAAAATTLMTSVGTGQVGAVNSDAMFGMAETVGKQFLETGWAKTVPGLERTMVTLRIYFAVDNNYVKKKMGRVLFPFIFRDWRRLEGDPIGPDPSSITYALPHSDENAPDLYLPSMSLITYVLLCALCYGTAGKFDPDVLPDVTSKCLITQLLEVVAIRIGYYLMEVPVSILDLFSYTGYKYLGLSVNMLSGLTLGHLVGYGHRAYYLTFFWTATAISYFILKVMANNIPMRTSAAGPKRKFMVLGFAGSQFATCWFVSQTKFLE